MAKHKSNIRYKDNKDAKVGTELICPICGKSFVKKQWAQAFCCSKCKDAFWNRKGDRHREGYYEDYDIQHPERIRRRILYGATGNVTRGMSCAQVREIDEHRMSVAAKLDQYTDKELADMYRNHKYGELPYLTEETENLFGRDESCHPFDIDGQLDEIDY